MIFRLLEHRSEIDVKYRKKIEAIVRKQRPSAKESEDPPKMTSCPFCNTTNVPESDLYCGQCKSNLVTFYHLQNISFTCVYVDRNK